MKHKRLYTILSFVLALLLLLTACGESGGQDVDPGGNGEGGSSGNWTYDAGWTVNDGTLVANASGETYAWYNGGVLYDEWDVSVDMQLQQSGRTDCGRIVLAAEDKTPLLVFSVLWKEKKVSLQVDAFRSGNWTTVYTSAEDIAAAADQPIRLLVHRSEKANKLELELSQNDATLLSATTDRIPGTAVDTASIAGLSIYDANVQFTNFRLVSEEPVIIVTEPQETLPLETVEIGESVETSDWALGANCYYNEEDGQGVVIIDGEGENYAWDAAHPLGDEWNISFDVVFGKSYRDTICARIPFGRQAVANGSFGTLVTVNYDARKIMLQIQDNEDGAWIWLGGKDWTEVSGNHIRLQLTKFAGVNRIEVKAFDGDRVVFDEVSDEISQSMIDTFRYYGLMVYSSQVKYSNFAFEGSTGNMTMPETTERDTLRVSELTLGENEPTDRWQLSKNAIYFTENGQDAICVDTKGEEYCYRTAPLTEPWTLKTRLEFGKYYNDVAGCRQVLTDEGLQMTALITFKYSLKETNLLLEFQSLENNQWSPVVSKDWVATDDTAFDIEISGSLSGEIHIVVRGANHGKTVLDVTGTLPSSLASRIRYIGLGGLGAEVKYSAIDLTTE